MRRARNRLARAAAVTVLLLTLPAAVAPAPVESDDADAFRKRMEGIRPRDAAALLDAGKWCEEQGHATWAYQCYGRAVKVGEGPAGAEAAFRMARIEIARQRYEEGFAKLRDLVERQAHQPASEALRAAETQATRAQADLVAKGDLAFAKGNAREARKLYGQAYALLPGKPAAAPFLPRKELLAKVAKCVDLMDDEYYKDVVQPVERSFADCGSCEKDGGFVICGACGGKGTRQVRLKSALRRGLHTVPCGGCQKFGWVFCKRCLGLQSYTDSAKLSDREKKAIAEIVNKVRSIKVLTLPFAKALEAVEEVLLGIEESSTISYFRSLKPRYKLSGELKSAMQKVPPDTAGLGAAVAAWKTAEKDARIRSNFLSSYAIDFALALKPFEMLRASKKKVDFRSPPKAAALAAEGLVSPEVLSAFPEDGAAGWVAVKGTLVKYKVSPKEPYQGRLEIQGDLPHNVNFFVWLPAAKARLKWLEKTSWSARLAALGDAYPFDVQAKAAAAPPGRQIIVAGRFLRDRLGFPRNWFEVWDLHVGLTRVEESALAALSEPVDMEFQAVKLGEAAKLLQALHGVPIECPGSEDALLALTASEAPLGLVIDALARAVKVSWSYDGSTARIGGAAAVKGLAAAVAEELRAAARGKVEARRAEGGTAAAVVADLPADPAALRARAEEAGRRMDYALALDCHDKLLAAVPAGDERRRLEVAREKFRLFHELTRRTPVSGLVQAGKLERLTIKNAAGDVSVQTVEVLGEDEKSIRVRPGYGGRIPIKKSLVIERKPLAALAWRAEKESEMKERLGKAAARSPREKAADVFLLALFAKTYGFAVEGTGMLEQAIALDDFAWLLETYFPERASGLIASWRTATGREPPSAAPPPPEPPPPPAAAALHPDEPIPPAAEDLLPFARRHYDQGRVYLSQSLPGMEEAQTKLKLALEHFRAVQTALERVSAGSAGEAEAAGLRRDVSLMIQTCVKGLAFFD